MFLKLETHLSWDTAESLSHIVPKWDRGIASSPLACHSRPTRSCAARSGYRSWRNWWRRWGRPPQRPGLVENNSAGRRPRLPLAVARKCTVCPHHERSPDAARKINLRSRENQSRVESIIIAHDQFSPQFSRGFSTRECELLYNIYDIRTRVIYIISNSWLIHELLCNIIVGSIYKCCIYLWLIEH